MSARWRVWCWRLRGFAMSNNDFDHGRHAGIILPKEAQRQTWQYKAVAATRGNQSRLGLIVLGIIGKTPQNPPFLMLRPGLVITEDGDVLCDWIGSANAPIVATCLGDITEVRDNLRRLADHLKLSDPDRIAMFEALQRWVYKDFRATSEA